jgi:hypothetical protein
MCVISIPFYLLWLWGKKSAEREREYEKLYLCIEAYIETYEINEWNYKTILNELVNLGQLRYKDREKTSVLTTKFFRKYRDIAKLKAKE